MPKRKFACRSCSRTTMSTSISLMASTFRTRTNTSRARVLTNKLSSQLSQSSKCSVQRRTFASTPQRRFSDSSRRGESSEGNAGPSQGKSGKQKSAHAAFYRDTLPAMIPVALLGSAVYLVSFTCLPCLLACVESLTRRAVIGFQVTATAVGDGKRTRRSKRENCSVRAARGRTRSATG